MYDYESTMVQNNDFVLLLELRLNPICFEDTWTYHVIFLNLPI